MPAIPQRGGWLWRLILAILAAGTAWSACAWYCSRLATPVPPPPLTPQFLNTQAGVAYVGSERCGQCHVAEATTYAEHPMGKSVRPASQILPAQHKAVPSFDAYGLHYAVERRGNQVWHRETLPVVQTPAVEIVAEVAFAIGSGRQGQSFVVDRDGRFFQSPISWFVQKNAWDLSPGFNQNHLHFNRVLTESCLFCHCNEAHGKVDTLNEFVPKPLHLQPIGCERCHGPGALHVAVQERGGGEGGMDRTIVNPQRLTPQLREAVCEQCHLQGEARIVHAGTSLWSYRPGLPLERFVSVFVAAANGDTRKAVSHVEQMHQSRCFQASGGKMGCISCHDPHVLPSEDQRVAWYRSRCMSCHQESSCGLPIEERRQHTRADSCIVCHMPRRDSSNITHTSITDHRIVRRQASAFGEDAATEIPLVRFHFGTGGAGDDTERDLGLALVELAERSKSESQRRRLAHQACLLLAPAVKRQPGDVAAWEALGQALWRDKRLEEALDCLEKAVQLAPRREVALQTAALVTLELNQVQQSIAYGDRVFAINPYSWQNHAFRGQALALRRQWAEAVEACEKALRLDPFERRTRMLLIDCLIRQGQLRRARNELEILLALDPPQSEQLHEWFNELKDSILPAKK